MTNKDAINRLCAAHDRAVGQRLKALRKERRLSQTAIAEALGVSFQQYQKYENGKNRISAGRLHVCAKFMKVDVAAFFEGLD
ncbi:MAG: helix-turn-helix transcriptional regulator [Alphaproteobacteria bacterium]|nr:helix-turn-helix transcriptional regulator [Alphaproteobacteria bacterium]